jgi:hypothetical protein
MTRMPMDVCSQGRADIEQTGRQFRFDPNSDMAAYPNSNQRALMDHYRSVATSYLAHKGNLCPTNPTAEGMSGSRVRRL